MKIGLVFCCTALILIFGMSAFADTFTTTDSQNSGGTFVGGGTLANIYVVHSEFVFTGEDATRPNGWPRWSTSSSAGRTTTSSAAT